MKLTIYLDADLLSAVFVRRKQAHRGVMMIMDVSRIIAQEAGFTVIEHASGFTALRENDNRYLLFLLGTGEWSIYDGQTAQLVRNGLGLASFLAAARCYFNLPAENTDTAQRAYAA